MTRRWSPVLIDQTHPALKKKENFKEVLIHNHSQQIFSADLLSRFSSADLLSGFSQQIFSADFLSRSSQQIFFSRSSQQIFSADFLSRSSQQIFSADLLSRSSQQILSRSSQQIFSQQIFSADLLSRFSQQIFSADLLIVLSFAVVRGWWSAIVLSFLSFAVVRGWWSAIVLSFAVVRGWWSAIVLSCWWSILHEFFRRTLSRSFREKNKEERRTIKIFLSFQRVFRLCAKQVLRHWAAVLTSRSGLWPLGLVCGQGTSLEFRFRRTGAVVCCGRFY